MLQAKCLVCHTLHSIATSSLPTLNQPKDSKDHAGLHLSCLCCKPVGVHITGLTSLQVRPNDTNTQVQYMYSTVHLQHSACMGKCPHAPPPQVAGKLKCKSAPRRTVTRAKHTAWMASRGTYTVIQQASQYTGSVRSADDPQCM